MKFTAQKKYVFYPDINGNLDLPESERLSVEIIRPTAEDHDSLVYVEQIQQRKDTDTGMVTTSSHTRFNTSKILRRHAGEIKNLTVADAATGKETPITNGEELAVSSFAGMFPLVNAICIEVCADKIQPEQKKISKSDSASSGEDGTSGSSGPNTQTKK
jgi:hypothetical protein